MRESDFVSGFARGLKVIEAFGETRQRLSIAEAAKLTGLDRATVRRSLLTLAELGYADYDGKFFMLTPKILRLGHAYLQATTLPALLQPHLDHLSEQAGQSASASVLDGTEIVYIARAAQRRVMSINLTPGSRLPAYCASMGRVLLAALSETEARAVLARSELKQNTAKTKTDPEELIEEFRRVRAEGYAVIDQELEIGLCSIAVPVENDRGETIAAINIGAPAALVPAAEMKARYLKLLRETQAALRPLLRR
ncbi:MULTISPECIES: IclR family transcriptional regulator domain-containing protein [Rhizobium]|uniref:IclR family transcriptional regulator domain-containing protein n=1 Tax=Rhizobium TaxID=379 RepID=UPI0007EB50C9|nr:MULTISPECIES: IclR family transcriptional regulator C-terminal domain-containing protein [Rhizobium]ANK94624.1 Pca operon transcriptional regulator PcaR [Rhizobium sp. N6212]ANL00674.1 Pca operon transcriptional regulator PcaR [Rhizobium sp. N621]ANL06795.1 Pca operon transcriptional regulator PcaR [Rhizobium esperanzae]ANL12966.1 Pca operon transcriptional regulator PcaR [Rhizobium sp. N1341]ANL24951.1 Pca operon transcriptional regulator PcaR [Rhizobium sp. N113]